MSSWRKLLAFNKTEDGRDGQAIRIFHPGSALRRLMYVALIGSFLIVIYASGYARVSSSEILSVISVGLMAGGAALLTGGLLGFLFGVPHTREEGTSQWRNDSDEQSENTRNLSTTYRPNTSLEQIADWLTKILVGVGLVQIQAIPGKLVGLANYVAKGLGNGEGSDTFALAILIYFSVCGFVFGFLWARLYLPRWFRDADDIRILEEKVTELQNRQVTDARALALIDKLLSRSTDDPVAQDSDVAEAIRLASKPVKTQIFTQVQKVSENNKAEDYDLKLEGVISALNGLIKSDKRERYHRNHSELGYALRRKKPQEWQQAENEFTKAIEIRNKQGIKGWKSYEFQRARCRIELDEKFKKLQPSGSAVADPILNDLREAYSDSEKWKRRSDPKSSEAAQVIQKWRDLNDIQDDKLARR